MTTQNKKPVLPLDGLAGLKQNWKTDLLAGFMVALLAMPLSLGIAKASSFPAIFGLVTAIIGGIIVSTLMGARLTIKGPAAGLIVIASGCVTEFGDGETGWHLALGAIIVAGIIQTAFAYFKLGKLADFFPNAAIHGMLAAIGIIIMSKQIHLLLGIDPTLLKGKTTFELIGMLPYSIIHENAHLAEIGLASLLILIILTYIKNQQIKKIPAPLVVLAVSIPLGFALHIKTEGAIANFALVKIGSIVDAYSSNIIKADFSGMISQPAIFFEYVVLFALIGSLESLLTAKAIDNIDVYKRKSDFNKDLLSVGVGNLLSGLLGGLPMISEVARSSANVGYGAKTRWANFFHGIFLLVAILFAVPFIEMIPSVALAAMLVFVGYRLASPKEFKHMWENGKDQFLIFTTTIIITLTTDLLLGVASGMLLEIIFNVLKGTSIKSLFTSNIQINQHNENNYHLQVNKELVFSNIISYKNKFAKIPTGKRIHIDVSKARYIDITALMTLEHIAEDYKYSGGQIEITGIENHRKKINRIH